MEDFFTAVMATIRKAVETQFKGNISRASQAWGVTGDNLNKWLNGTRSPTLEKISPILNQIGAYLACSNESGRNVCFVNAKIAPAVEGALPPEAEDYMAAPLVGEVGRRPRLYPPGRNQKLVSCLSQSARRALPAQSHCCGNRRSLRLHAAHPQPPRYCPCGQR